MKKMLTLLSSAACLALVSTGCQPTAAKKSCTPCPKTQCRTAKINYTNSEFYDCNGFFKPETAKQAYYDMMSYYNYPIPPVLKTGKFWICDFQTKDMANLGMAGIFWVNDKGTYAQAGQKQYHSDEYGKKPYGYLGHEIYMLANQTLPTHRHLAGHEGFGAKMESWHVRYGKVRFYSEYKNPGSKLISDLPEDEKPWGYGKEWYKCKYYLDAGPGETVTLNNPESWHHLQDISGIGSIISEYATYHNHVTFAKPGMSFKSTAAKK